MKKGWGTYELSEHIRLIDYRGRTPKKTSSGVRLITAKNVKLGYLQRHPEEFIAEDNYEDWMRRGIPNYGDVIFTTEAPLANVAQLDTHEKVAFAQRTIVMQPNLELIQQTYLKYLLLSPDIREDIFSNGTGATVTGIKSSLLKKIKIPIPPLSEQEEIVEVLDKAFAAIDQAKANIEQNIANAKELFQSKLNQIFSQKGEGWVETTMGKHATFRNGMNFSKTSSGEEVKVIGVGDFLSRFWVPSKNLETKTLDGKLSSEDQLHISDFLFVRSNGNKKLIGRCMLVNELNGPTTHSGFTIRMRLSDESFYPPYLCWFYKSDIAKT